jgi:glycosyltransferase involved in cell wall biosynthesis
MKICMLVTNTVAVDPRVRREASALAEAGHEVVVIGVAHGGAKGGELDGFTVRLVEPPRHLNPREWVDRARDGFLVRFKETAPQAYGLLAHAYVAVRYRGRWPTPAAAPTAPAAAPPLQLAQEPFRARARREARDIGLLLKLDLAMARAAEREAADVYHAHDLDTLLAGHLARRRTGARLVYDFHEIWLEQLRPGVRTPIWRETFEKLEGWLAPETDLRLTVCDSLGAWLSEKYGVGPCVTVRNIPRLQPLAPRERPRGGRVRLLYHGIYMPDRGLENLIEAMRYLPEAELIMRGFASSNDFESRLKAHAAAKGVADRVAFVPPVPVTELVERAREADIGLAPFTPACLNTYYCLPNKLFEYLAAGLAIGAADLPELRRLVQQHAVGVLFDPSSPRAMADGLRGLIADPRALAEAQRNARRAAETQLNWDVEKKRLLDAYATLPPRGAPRRGAGKLVRA